MADCEVCGDEAVRVIRCSDGRRRCRARCYPYWRRTGHDRSEDLVIRDNERDLERRLAAKAWRPPPGPTEGERVRARIDEATSERRERLRRGRGAGT